METNRGRLAFLLIVIGAVGIIYLGFFTPTTYNLARAEEVADDYMESLDSPDIAIDEIMEFEQNFYVVYYEKTTGMGAFEMLIDKESGRIFPEYGPNMMWNTKYGHGGMMGGSGGMMGGFTQPRSGDDVSEEEALQIAQGFLDEVYPGSEADDPHPFYGYYTIHTIKDGEIFGMLSVNTYDGAVWYHNWHGEYIQSLESH
jgi:hypothetical protein